MALSKAARSAHRESSHLDRRLAVLLPVLCQALQITLHQIVVAIEERVDFFLRRALRHHLGEACCIRRNCAAMVRSRPAPSSCRLPQQIFGACDVFFMVGEFQRPIVLRSDK